MELLERISELCKEKGISMRQMEKEAGLGAGSTSKWKNGFYPNRASMKKLSDFFGVSISYLQGESNFRAEQKATAETQQNSEIEATLRDMLNSENEAAKAILEALATLDDSEWKVLQKIINQLRS